MPIFYSILLYIFGLSACSQKLESEHTPKTIEVDNQTQEYTFAVHPLHNPSHLFEVFNPLIQHLNSQIPSAHFKLEASRDYATFDDKLRERSVDFALPNPYQTLIAINHHYDVIAKMGDDFNFKGIILARKDSQIKEPKDLKGKSISYPAPTALAATMLPQEYLHSHGININTEVESKYVGSQESAIMNVFLGTTDAGATWPPPWHALTDKNPALKEQLEIIGETQSLPNNSVVARKGLPKTLVLKVQTALVNLHYSVEGQAILQTMYLSKFEHATNETYDPVVAFIEHFNKHVRPL